MFNIGQTTWNGIKTLVFDASQETSDAEGAFSMKIAGIFTTRYTEETYGSYKDALRAFNSPGMSFIADAVIPDENLIFIEKSIIDALSNDELNAMLHHEHAHILKGDVERAVSEGVKGIMVDIGMELAADAHGASMVSKEAMVSGIKKLIKLSSKELAPRMGTTPEEFEAHLLASEHFVQRFEALS